MTIKRRAKPLVKGTTAEIAAYTGPVGEVAYNEEKKTLVAQDGMTQGGFNLALLSLAQVWTAVQTFAAGLLADEIGEKTAGAGVTVDGTLLKDAGIFLGGTGPENFLDNKDSGTFTPFFTATGATFTYAVQEGFYLLLGEFVYVQLKISVSSVSGTPSGFLGFGGFPVIAASAGQSAIPLRYNFGVSPYVQLSNLRNIYWGLSALSSTGYLQGDGDAYGNSNLPADNFQTPFYYSGAGIYRRG